MRTVRIFCAIFLFYALIPTMKAQDYSKEWKTIDSLESKGLPESALKETEKLYQKIKANAAGNAKQVPQLLKALIYVNKYQLQLEEDGLVKSIYRLQTEMEAASMPAKALLQSMVAEAYDQYLLNHLYKFQDRTVVDSEYKLDDIRTWDIERIVARSTELHWAAVRHPEAKAVPLGDLEGLVTKENATAKGCRPTLYDLLVHRAIDFFMSERTYLKQPAYRFYIDQPQALADAAVFMNYNFQTRDSSAHSWQVLRLMQEALRFHAGDADKTAFADLDLKRLQYTYGASILPDKSERYMATLQAMENQYAALPISTEIGYYIAQYHYGQSQNYQARISDAFRWEAKKAVELCDKAAIRFPNSYGAALCRNLKRGIQAKHLGLTCELVTGLQTPMLARLEYRNTEQAHLRTVRIGEKEQQKLETLDTYEKIVEYLRSLPTVFNWSVQLRNEGDYQLHSVETAIPAHNQAGYYAVLVSGNDKFTASNNAVYVGYFNVSSLTYFQRSVEGIAEYYVTDRRTGQPQAGVKVEFMEQRYNSLLRRYEWRKRAEGLTDDKGWIRTPEAAFRKEYSYVYAQTSIKLSKGADVLHLKQVDYSYKQGKETPNERPVVHFFTDRAIYRPGQTVYFKGIVIKGEGTRTPRIVSGHKTKVTFLDANYQEVSKTELVANDYGSFHGSFAAPASGLTGVMYLRDESTQSMHSFRVEEYKRPKFEVKFNPLEGSFRLEDQVTVKGNAKTYSGVAIDEGKVQYRVVRVVEFPYWSWWYWGWRNPYLRSEQEVAQGEAMTNAQGEFEIRFHAVSDKTIPASTRPQFTYRVYADVTDNTGETHSTTTRVVVGYVALNAGITVPESMNNDKETAWAISTLNLNGEFEPAKGSVRMEQLQVPGQAYTARLWEKPDYDLLAQAEFAKLFPQFAFGKEDEVGSWKALKTVLDVNFDTKTSKELSVNPKTWSPGYYKITLQTQDKFGEKIEVVRYCSVQNPAQPQVVLNQHLFVNQRQWTAQPGDQVSAAFGSYNKGAYILMEVSEGDGKILSREWINTQSPDCQQRQWKIEERHRGNFFVYWTMVGENRLYTHSATVSVPWSNKELNIELATFRDKLLPGQEEEWKLVVSGDKKDKVLAELMLSMYDASLDKFAVNAWSLDLYPYNYGVGENQASINFTTATASALLNGWNEAYESIEGKYYPALDWFGFSFYDWGVYDDVMVYDPDTYMMAAEMPAPSPSSSRSARDESTGKSGGKLAQAEGKIATKESAPGEDLPTVEAAPEEGEGDPGEVSIRTALQELVFFMPQIMTDEQGNAVFKFKMNEALTRWKFMALAHSKDLRTGYAQAEVVTQKDLMITPNPPRFFRQRDELFFTAKVANMTKGQLKGQATLQLFDAVTGQSIDAAFGNTASAQSFEVDGERSVGLSWSIKVPAGWTNAVTHRVVAKAGSFSDGEESALPVLTNQMLVTETMPLPVRGSQTKEFNFARMAEVSKSNTLRQHSFTLEFTPNPAWYAIQALPYMMEYPYECTEQIFSRFYSNSLASSVANAHPKIKKVFDTWSQYQPSALESNLLKNQELKYALIEETPWVLNAQSEAQQKKNVAVLFDLNRMAKELDQARDKMAQRQLANGGFAWFPGGRDNWYITQYIVEGFGHLDAMGVKSVKSDKTVERMTSRAVTYIDEELARHYQELLRWLRQTYKDEAEVQRRLAEDHLDYMAIHYLYARSFFLGQPVANAGTKTAIEYYEGQAKKYWLNKSDYMQGMLALGIHRKGADKATPQDIVKSLKERALKSEEMGMYWKYPHGYYWYELPVETHALMIEVFDEVAADAQAVDDLKTWLLKAKQTTHWKTTKATAAACYALLRRGDNWLLEDKDPVITLGSQKLDLSKVDKEAGTGYFKTTWKAEQIKPEMAKVKVENPNKNVAWGAIYWQYFEDLDKITHFQETPLKIDKKLFKVVRTDKGEVLKPIATETLVPGDLVRVRIEIRVDRDMEYVHLKDMRASGFEPVNVLSQYKYQGGMGYYESTKDMATHFFMDYLSKGTYVFEYSLRANLKGNFSNGITTMQCMYAPEFTTHSEGIRIDIK